MGKTCGWEDGIMPSGQEGLALAPNPGWVSLCKPPALWD